MMHGGRAVPGFALGNDRLADALRHVARTMAAFQASLSDREKHIAAIALHAAHAEEAIAAGDALRADAHITALVDGLTRIR